jgi:hypothetical protein
MCAVVFCTMLVERADRPGSGYQVLPTLNVGCGRRVGQRKQFADDGPHAFSSSSMLARPRSSWLIGTPAPYTHQNPRRRSRASSEYPPGHAEEKRCAELPTLSEMTGGIRGTICIITHDIWQAIHGPGSRSTKSEIRVPRAIRVAQRCKD